MEKIKLINSSGVEEEYDIVLSYEDPRNGKGYLVYTDGNKKYIARYNPDDDNDLNLETVDSEEEINMIKNIMRQSEGV